MHDRTFAYFVPFSEVDNALAREREVTLDKVAQLEKALIEAYQKSPKYTALQYICGLSKDHYVLMTTMGNSLVCSTSVDLGAILGKAAAE